ncbi:MAG: cellulase family glycosylhydrolase [Spirochaetales bacterium]|nr:cellulase family glycosylhydrolase [Spirochaetales bacterium]
MKKYIAIVVFIMTLIAASTLFSQEIEVLYRCAQPEEEINKIKPQFKILNKSDSSLALSDLTVRYWFTAEGYVESELSIDYAAVGSSNVSGSFTGEYLRIAFGSGAGSIPPGGDSGEIQLRIEKTSHGYYIQTDDYSFDPSFTDFSPHTKVTCYRNASLVWGNEPPAPTSPPPPPPSGDDWLSVSGNTIRDRNGNAVRLTGINWFGFETNPLGLGGLQSVNWMHGFNLISERGFNILRLPLSLEIVSDWKAGRDTKVQFVDGTINPRIDGISSLTLLDTIMEYCKTVGLKVMLDMHCLNNNVREALWYNGTYSLAALKSGWQWLAERYGDDDTVIAADIFNEPHGQSWVDVTGTAKWDGSNDSNNWRKAAGEIASSILSVNPNILIMVEGIECYPVEGAAYGSTDKYDYLCNWWGGNLRGVADYPVDLGSHRNKLVYSPHDYGPDIYVQPWFDHSFDINSLAEECWRPNWYFIVESNTAPILIGEWGGKLGGDNQRWLSALASFIDQNGLNHTFWCFNPDSHDTGGIVGEDWNTIDESKYNIVRQSLWRTGSGAFIGLDHEVILGTSGKNTNVGHSTGDTTPVPVVTTPPTSPPTSTPDPTAPPGGTAVPTPGFLMGDVNGDGTVNIVDALLAAQYYVGLEPAGFDISVADTNCDGTVNIVDALLIAQYYVGLVDGFCGE